MAPLVAIKSAYGPSYVITNHLFLLDNESINQSINNRLIDLGLMT